MESISLLKGLGWVFEKLGSVIVSETAKKVYSKLKTDPNRFFYFISFSVSRHYADVEKKIERMPFIYMNLDGYVIADFVEVDILPLDLKSTKNNPVQAKILTDVGKEERLRRKNKVLFLGSAGIGKTTFQCFTILKLMKDRKQIGYLYEFENPIPVFVPLKAVENSGPFPILKYIIENNKLVTNSSGLKKLTKLASKGELFLFLDGYDEIQFPNSEKGINYLHEELSYIFGAHTGTLQAKKGSEEFMKFYNSLGSCRVWLSSRREFFERLPIKIHPAGVGVVEQQGIGNKRVQLAKNIFDKYRKQNPAYINYLNEEYFLSDIDTAEDTELAAMSYNPLFLTIMCYVYATKAIETRTHRFRVSDSFNDLIIECMKLLLRDLDEAKARDLPQASRGAVLNRRNDFPEEKEAFLPYFASELFREKKNVFDLEYVNNKAIEFFLKNDDFPNARQIVKSLKENLSGNLNFSEQLINSGIFVFVDRSHGINLYDFPHRRFKEVLASKYLASDYGDLVKNLDDKSKGELILVALNNNKDFDFVDSLLSSILERTVNRRDADYYAAFFLSCLEKKPEDYNPRDVICGFLLSCVSRNEMFSLDQKVLNTFAPRDEFISKIADCLEKICKRR